MKRKNRVETLLKSGGDFNALIVKSPADIAYLIGICFPYPNQSVYSAALVVKENEALYTLIIPVEWECVLKNFNWKGKKVVYSINDGSPDVAFRKALKSCIDAMDLADKTIAVDYSKWTAGEINFLKTTLPELKISKIDEQLSEMRVIKSPEEINNIQSACYMADRGLIGALNHVEGTIGFSNYTLAEFLERCRIHAIEFGANSIGHLNIAQGATGFSWYSPVNDFTLLENGNSIRVDFSVLSNGSWGSCGRTCFAGKPDQKDIDAYNNNIALKNFAVSLLKPGVKISDICEEVRNKADEMEVEILLDESLGHGIGMSEHEKPFLTEDNEETLAENMVIALDVKTLGGKNELIHSVDVYQIVADGSRKLSDFRNWDSYYCIDGLRATN